MIKLGALTVITFCRKNRMELFYYPVSFMKFCRNFQTNCYPRKEDTVLDSLIIDYSYLTKSFSLRKGEAPVCVACNAVITVKHILTGSADLVEIRKKYFEERSLYSIFPNVIPECFFYFLREIGVFDKI